MLLVEKIDYIFLLLKIVSKELKEQNPVTRRMYAIGLINEMYQISSQLSIINEQLDTSLSFEDANLDFSLLENKRIECRNLLDEKMYVESTTSDSDINRSIDFFPLGNVDYSFTSKEAERFKTGMRYLCSDANLSPRNIVYALNKGIESIFSLLLSIKKKKLNIKDFQYEDFWNDFLFRDDDLYFERALNDYEKWKEEHECQDIQALKDKLIQETLVLLKSGVFFHDTNPVRREINNSIVKISEDALEEGTEVPDYIKTECAKFSKYVVWKDDILCFDYVKLGKYIYNHYPAINEDEGNSLIYYENIILLIHQDMAALKPKLKKFLKFYEEDELEAVLISGLELIRICDSLIKDNVPQDFLSKYLHDAFYSETKTEVRAKLKGQSRFTIICNMLGMIKTTQKVFKPETTSADLASALASVVQKPKQDSLKRYIDQGASDYHSKLSKWTTQYVTDKLGTESEKMFVRISQK